MPKRRTNQNLVPKELVVWRIRSMVMSKALIIIAVCAVLAIGYYYGCKLISESLNSKAEDITANSAYTEMVNLQGQISTVKTEIEDLNTKIKQGTSQISTMNYEIERNTKIHDISNYIVTSKPNSVTIIMIEDAKTNSIYSNKNSQSSGSETGETGSLDGADSANGSNGANSANSANSAEDPYQNEYDPYYGESVRLDVLQTNGDPMADSLIIRGFAPDMNVLSEYAETLEKCDLITGYNVSAIESIDITDYSIYLFNIVVTF